MSPTRWTARHDRALAEAAPELVEPTSADLDRVWDHIAVGMASEVRPRRRWRIAVGVGIGAVVLGMSGAATADYFSARTGLGPVDAEDLSLGGPGERLDPAASDYGTVIAEETADIPFPSAASREVAVAEQVRDARFAVIPGEQQVSTGAIRAWVADAAMCAWSNQWAAATRDGSDSARTKAIDMILQAPTWPAVTAIDPDPSMGPEGVDDDSQFFYLASLGEAVQGTDVGAVAKVLAMNNGYCRPALVPDIPAADSLYTGR